MKGETYLIKGKWDPWYVWPCASGTRSFGCALGGALLDAVPEVDEATPGSAGGREGAGSEGSQGRLN